WRVDAWLSEGVDDMLDVSVPWATSDRVQWTDSALPLGAVDDRYPVLVREYDTPDGRLKHAVRWIQEGQARGWVTQPDHVPLIEDFNVARGVQHLVTTPEDVGKMRWLFGEPAAAEASWLRERMALLRSFAQDRGVMIQAWSAFGADAAVWLAGAEGAVMLCMEQREAFEQLLAVIHAVDIARTRLALEEDVDMVVQRGWYSSTDFWSPRLFRECFKPRIGELAALAHSRGKLFAYVMTTGVMTLGPDLADAGVDLLYYADPVQDHVDLAEAAARFRGRLAVAGGINSGVTLSRGSADEIRTAVRDALSAFGDEGGFILSPVDALFPDTPTESVDTMIDAWREWIRAARQQHSKT
ncbi:MAG TPA: uroporphyrinogen decarboxylase family protein, partial [Thermoleophilia bacterium]|nr:uroporphyrinogen decarboxylase family protein [Thermoleophilia bacterium]